MRQDALNRLLESINEGDTETALSLIEPVDRELDRNRTLEQARLNIVRGVLAHAESSEQTSTASNLFTAIQSVQQRRLSVGFYIGAFINGNTKLDDLSSPINELIAAQNTVSNQAEQLRDELNNVTLPPLLAIIGPDSNDVPLGSSTSISVDIVNIGNSSVEEISIDVETSLDLRVDPNVIASLSPDSRTAVDLTGKLDTAGEFSPKIIADASNVSESKIIQLIVADKKQYLERALSQVHQLKSDIKSKFETIEGAIMSLIKRLDAIKTQIEEAIRKIEQGLPGNSIHNTISASINDLKSFITQAKRTSESELTKKQALIFSTDAESIIATLESSLEAEQSE